MFRRWAKAAKQPESSAIDDPASTSNIKMLLIATAFLLVTIGLILLQPGTDPSTQHATAVDTPVPAVEQVDDIDAQVSRSDASLLELDTLSASEAVSRQLRQPIRLTDTDASRSDLRSLTATVLAGFGHQVQNGDRLQSLLVQALTEGQSNAYIDALLNTAAARGEFKPPIQLQMSSGRLDTETLLLALVRYARG
ncbi:hypothetical protein [uncultured Tateyamaria sp.]|uniref:hypothetical protein n=2 Tax=uncultured Tateyamaria sp. TaxID=455651 RepID=UPI002606BF20|nr:hypothetical protein [uncultured Tateyamaria sp.]